MRRCQSAPNVMHVAKTPIQRKKCSSHPKLHVLDQAAPEKASIVIETLQAISLEKGVASGECFELYGMASKAPGLQSAEDMRELAECLVTPVTDDRGLGEIVRTEFDRLINGLHEARKRQRQTLPLSEEGDDDDDNANDTNS